MVPVIRSCQSHIWIWLVNYLHLHLHLHLHTCAKPGPGSHYEDCSVIISCHPTLPGHVLVGQHPYYERNVSNLPSHQSQVACTVPPVISGPARLISGGPKIATQIPSPRSNCISEFRTLPQRRGLNQEVRFLAQMASRECGGMVLWLSYTEKPTEAMHRHKRQQRHKQKHQQPNHAATKQPTNKTRTYTPVLRHAIQQQALPPCEDTTRNTLSRYPVGDQHASEAKTGYPKQPSNWIAHDHVSKSNPEPSHYSLYAGVSAWDPVY